MASTRLRETKDGRAYYEIRIRPEEGKEVSRRWYVPDGWSKRAIDRELAKQAAELERLVKAGEVQTRREIAAEEAERAAEQSKIQTLRQYVERVFMPTVSVRCSENTRTSYDRIFRTWVFPSIGEIKMPEITSAQISAVLLELQKQGKAHASCVKCYAVLGSLFKMAFLDDTIPTNPMQKVQRPKPRKDEKEKGVQAYTAQEARRITDALEQEPLKWRVYVRLLIDTGIRRGECSGLQWSDIDFEEGSISINRTLCYTPERGVYANTPKSGHSRSVPVGADDLRLLKQLRTEQAASCVSKWVFTHDGAPEPIHPDNPTRYLKNFAKRAGVDNLHPHKLRHTFASIAITNGADVASVSETLGHADKSTTLRMYTHADEASKRRTVNIVADAIQQS